MSKNAKAGKMLKLRPQSRPVLNELMKLSTDVDGNEIFVGLTHEESALYAHYKNPYNRSDKTENDIFTTLHNRHEKARLERLSAVLESRSEKKH